MADVTLHLHITSDALDGRVRALEARMATADETLTTLSTRLNDATNEIAADLQRLRDQLALLGEAVVAPATLAALDAHISRLEGLGVDPADPVPATP